jgi:hypothetical protein
MANHSRQAKIVPVFARLLQELCTSPRLRRLSPKLAPELAALGRSSNFSFAEGSGRSRRRPIRTRRGRPAEGVRPGRTRPPEVPGSGRP